MKNCMKRQPFERYNFSKILDLLDPDLTVEFKSRSYYNNEYQMRRLKKCEEAKNIDTYYGNYANESTISDSTLFTDTTNVSFENVENKKINVVEIIPLIDEDEKHN
jgi:uncharacterized protein YecE (DUF72 family)